MSTDKFDEGEFEMKVQKMKRSEGEKGDSSSKIHGQNPAWMPTAEEKEYAKRHFEEVMKKYRDTISGSLGEFIKKCQASKELKEEGLAVKVTKDVSPYIERSSTQNEMDYKLRYIAAFLSKIHRKKYEAYVIGRIWHQLNDVRVKFVFQQYIKRSDNDYAFADLYLPQLNIVIEVNELHHLKTVDADTKRLKAIYASLNADIKTIDCYDTIEKLHQRIDEVVNEIRQAITNCKDFIPWEGERELSADYHKKIGFLSVKNEDSVSTIDEACAIFGAVPKHKGFLRLATASIPNNTKMIVWCPSVYNKDWSNEPSDDDSIIREYHKTDAQKRTQHVQEQINKNEERVTFLKKKDVLGNNNYHFVGVFEIDKEQSLRENKCVWRRKSDYYKL